MCFPESRIFWNDIWGQPVRHNENAEWLKTLEEEQVDVGIQENIQINLIELKKQITRIPNWKCPGPDGVQGYWIKNLSAMHDRISNQLNECLQEESVPIWMVTGKTLLCVKEIEKGNIMSNFRPITCLPLLWKLLTAVLADELYRYLDEKKLLPWEQKGCRKGSRGTKDQLLIDKVIVKNCKRRLTPFGVAWVDYRKAYDLVPHSWIEKSMEMFGVAMNMRRFISGNMKQWNTELMSGNQRLGNVRIRRGIFQGDSLSPLLFVLAMIPLTLVLRKTKIFYQLKRGGEKINHLLFMDDLKLFAKSEEQIDSMVNSVRIFLDNIKMEFGLSKCVILIIKRGKVVTREGIDLPDGKMIKCLEEGSGYKYLGILETDGIKHEEMKD